MRRHGQKGAVDLVLAKSADGKAGFAKVSDRSATFSVDPTFMDELTLDPNDVRDRRVLAFNPRSVLSVAVAAKPDHQVVLQQNNNGWHLSEDGKLVPANRQRVVEMLKQLSTEEVAEFVAEAVAPADLAKWGLDDPHLKVELEIVRQNPDDPVDEEGNPNLIRDPVMILVRWVPQDNQPQPKYYATVKGSGSVVRLGLGFPTIVPIRPLDFRSVYLWPSFERQSLRKLTSYPPQPAPPLELEYLPATNDWTGKLAGDDVTALIDELAVGNLVGDLGMPLRADRWVTRNIGAAAARLENPVRRVRFVLEDAAGKSFDFGLDIAPVTEDVRSPFFYARPAGSKDICVIDRETFEKLDAPLVDLPEEPAPGVE